MSAAGSVVLCDHSAVLNALSLLSLRLSHSAHGVTVRDAQLCSSSAHRVQPCFRKKVLKVVS